MQTIRKILAAILFSLADLLSLLGSLLMGFGDFLRTHVSARLFRWADHFRKYDNFFRSIGF